MEDKKFYLQNLADQFHQWDVEIDELNARARLQAPLPSSQRRAYDELS